MSKVAIITARGGSKRIPRKNIKLFLGKPILAYSINAALESNLFEEVMVSTDDPEIAELARRLGAQTPFQRSAATSDDHATTSEVLIEVLEAYRSRGRHFDVACCIYPTAPFVTADKLVRACQLLDDPQIDGVIPVTRFSFPIWRAFRKTESNRVSYIWPENASKRSQDLEPSYHDAGQFYLFRVERFLAARQLVTKHTLGLEVSELEVQDIDTEVDWRLAEIKLQALFEGSC